MGDSKGLISAVSRKWKLEQIPSKKLEIENKLMEERLSQLKTELNFDKNKRNAMGGTIWSRAQPGPVTNYSKNVMKSDKTEPALNKLTNRQVKLQVLKDDYLQKQAEKIGSVVSKEKKIKCGQCEKNLAFTRCLECGEDYCANCFTSFHMKGALQKHRTVSITNNLNRQLSRPQSSDTRCEDNESIYDITSNRSNPSSAKKKVEFSLFDGTYDEKEAQKSFQQALSEWRNSSKNTEVNSLSRESSICKDAGVETQPGKTSQIQDLEDKIKSHSLSYAERMLLQKYKRNDLEVTPRNPLENSSQNFNSITHSIESQSLDHSTVHHLDFNSIINALDDGKKSQDQSAYLAEFGDLKPVNNLNFDELVRNNVTFEEVESQSQIKSVDLKLNLEPELIVDTSDSTKDSARPKLVKSSARVKTAQSKSARPKSSAKFEQNLSREPTGLLKNIAQRNGQSQIYAENEFLLMDVNNFEQKPVKVVPKSRPQTARIDPKLYAISPRSWNPLKSQVGQDKTNDLEKLEKKIELKEMKPKFNTQSPINVKSSLNFESKKSLGKKVDYDRAKSFFIPKNEKKVVKNKRPVSVSHNLERPASRINYEFAENFTGYDSDDGRSSRVCQNEDDNKYFGQLINEFKSSVITQISDLDEDKYTNFSDLTDSLNTSLSNLEMTIRNDDFDNDSDDLESLTMEELKSLQ